MVVVDAFCDGFLIFECADSMNIVCQSTLILRHPRSFAALWLPVSPEDQAGVKLASNFFFRLSVRHVGRMKTQVRLSNSLVCLVGRVISELVDT